MLVPDVACCTVDSISCHFDGYVLLLQSVRQNLKRPNNLIDGTVVSLVDQKTPLKDAMIKRWGKYKVTSCMKACS